MLYKVFPGYIFRKKTSTSVLNEFAIFIGVEVTVRSPLILKDFLFLRKNADSGLLELILSSLQFFYSKISRNKKITNLKQAGKWSIQLGKTD